MNASRVPGIAAACLLFVTLDVAVAQICKRTMDTWDHRASERRYRIPVQPYHHDLVPGVNLQAFWGSVQYPYATNNLGFRDARVRDVPLKSPTPRVLVIGDSFTEGVGVPFPETYVGRLQESLSAQGHEVLNAAVSSYAPAVYYRKVRHLVEEVGLDFDVLLVGIDVSDIADEALTYRMSPEGDVTAIEPAVERGARVRDLVKNNSLLVHVALLAKQALSQRAARETPEALGLGRDRALWTTDPVLFASFGERGLESARTHMDRLREVALRHGFRLAILVYPWPDQIARGDLQSRQVGFWEEWAASRGVPFYNAFPAFFDGAAPEETIRSAFIPFDVHWNAEGHRRIAETLIRQGFPAFVSQPVSPSSSSPRPPF